MKELKQIIYNSSYVVYVLVVLDQIFFPWRN
jgi:hypothetical protein